MPMPYAPIDRIRAMQKLMRSPPSGPSAAMYRAANRPIPDYAAGPLAETPIDIGEIDMGAPAPAAAGPTASEANMDMDATVPAYHDETGVHGPMVQSPSFASSQREANRQRAARLANWQSRWGG